MYFSVILGISSNVGWRSKSDIIPLVSASFNMSHLWYSRLLSNTSPLGMVIFLFPYLGLFARIIFTYLYYNATLSIESVFTNPLHDSPRLPLLKQLGDSHTLTVDTAEHKGEFGRVDAELGYLHYAAFLVPPLLPKFHQIPITGFLQCRIAV